MTLVSLDAVRRPAVAAPATRCRAAPRPARFSDAWPDGATELSAAEQAQAARDNRPARVLWAMAGAVAAPPALVAALMAVLALSGR